MRHKILATTILVLGLVGMATIAAAQESQVIHYQGMLTGPDGNPLRTDIYDVNFSIWDQPTGGVEPQWSEIQVVEVTNGLFDVFLGSDIPLSADVFTHDEGESDLRFLEIQVQDDDPMTPRTQIAKTPNSFVSARVLGDIQTGPGSLKMMDPGDDKVGFDVFTGGEGNSVKLMEPHDDGIVGLEMMADANGSSFKVNLAEPPDEKPGVEIMTSNIGPAGSQASFKMFNPQPEPPHDPVIEIKTMPNDAGYFAMNNLSGEEVGPLLEMTTDPTASSRIKIHAAQPTFSGRVEIQAQYTDGANMTLFREGLVPHNEIKAMDLRVGSDIGAELVIFNYASDVEQELLAISGSPSSGASFRMFNPQPEPPADPLLEMNTTQYGANFAMAAPQAGGLRNEITDPMFEVNVDADGAGLNMNDEIGKYMGFEPSPFTPGGAFYMNDPSTEETNVWIESSGRLVARKGIFGHDNTNDGNYNLAVGSYHNITGSWCFAGGYNAQIDDDYCFVWSDYPVGPAELPTQTSGDNQFLVRATGGAAFFSNANFTSGVALGPGESSWWSIIPPGPMLNSRPVDGQEILNKIERLPIKHYSNKGQDNGIEHIGPMPEDFNSLFGLGADDERISMLDPSGVALAGVQALLDKIEKLEARIAELEAERR